MRFVIVTAMLLSACGGGVRFTDSALNPDLPESYKNRTLWEDTGVLQYKLESLSGYVIYKKTGESTWRRRYQLIKDGYVSQIEAVKDGEVYRAKLDRKASTNATGSVPLLSAASSLSDKQLLELIIDDAAIVHIAEKDIPMPKLIEEAAKPRTGEDKRAWVQSVMLTKVIRKTYRVTEANATVKGATLGANGKVFNEENDYVRDSKITMLLVDLDELAKTVDRDVKSMGGISGLNTLDEAAQRVLVKRWLDSSRIQTTLQISAQE